MPFLDTLMKHESDGSISFSVYRKPTHTDQYLNFKSHHPLHQKLGVVRTLIDRVETLVSDDAEKKKEEQHIEKALGACGYPRWTMKKVKEQKARKGSKPKKQETKQNQEKAKGMVVIPYIEGLSEAFERAI